MSLYPERPIYSPWNDIGQALNQGAGIVNQFEQNRNALQALVDKRAEAAMERQRQDRDDAMRKTIYDQQQAERVSQIQSSAANAAAMKEFRDFSSPKPTFSEGKPYFSPGMGTNGEDSSKPVQTGSFEPTREQIQKKALALGVYGDSGIKNYMDATKPETGLSLEDRVVLLSKAAELKPPPVTKWVISEVNGRKIQVNPETGEQRDLGPVTPKASGKDIMVAKSKLKNLSVARQQLAAMRTAFKGIEGSFSAGPGQGWIPTPSGKSFDAAVDAFRNTLTGLTRVPGVGAQSDFEAKLSQAPLPKRGEYESVSLQKLVQLEDLVNTLDSGYSGMVQESGSSEAPSEEAPNKRSTILRKKYNY